LNKVLLLKELLLNNQEVCKKFFEKEVNAITIQNYYDLINIAVEKEDRKKIDLYYNLVSTTFSIG